MHPLAQEVVDAQASLTLALRRPCIPPPAPWAIPKVLAPKITYTARPKAPEVCLDLEIVNAFRAAVEASRSELALLAECRSPRYQSSRGTGKCDGALKAHPTRIYFSRG